MRVSLGWVVVALVLAVGGAALVQLGLILAAEGTARDAVQDLLSHWHPRAEPQVRRQAMRAAVAAGLRPREDGVRVSRVLAQRATGWTRKLGRDVAAPYDVRIEIDHRVSILGADYDRTLVVARTLHVLGATPVPPDPSAAQRGAGAPLPVFVE